MFFEWISNLPTILIERISNMTTAELVGQILGIIVIIGCILNSQLPKRWHMLMGQIFLNILSAVNMFLIGQGLSACLPCFVAATHCLVNVIRDRKGKPAPLWETIIFCSLYPTSWAIGFVLGGASVIDIIPLIALAFFIATVLSTNEQLMRWFTLGNATVYLIYNAIYGNVALIAHAFTIISVLIALFRYSKKPRDKSAES